MFATLRILGAFCLLITVLYADETSFHNPKLPIKERADDLISKLTLEEKASIPLMDFDGIPRFGLRAYGWWNECLHGLKQGKTTVFPQACSFGATFDPDLIYDVATAIADEARARHVRGKEKGFTKGLTFWSPVINAARDPRWGRNEETYSEDPLVLSKIGVAYVKGLQGNDSRYLKLAATPKHFVANNRDDDRYARNAVLSERTLREYYFPAYKATVMEGGAKSIMGAYNSLNNVSCCTDDWLLNKVLREEWGFDGVVVTDVGVPGRSVCPKMPHFEKSRTLVEAMADLLNGGSDVIDYMKINRPRCGPAIVEAIKTGLLEEKVLDRTVHRILSLWLQLGMYDPPEMVDYEKTPESVVSSQKHRDLAAEVARKSIVLLKNKTSKGQSFLPLDIKKTKSIAVIGPFAEHTYFGNYSGSPVKKEITAYQGILNKVKGTGIEVNHISFLEEVARSAVPVPAEAIRHIPERRKPSVAGLKGTYSSNDRSKKDKKKFTRIDSNVDFDWGDGDTLAVSDDFHVNDGISVLWDGKVVVPETGYYYFGLKADGKVSLRVKDHMGIIIYGKDGGSKARNIGGVIHLTSGEEHDLRVNYSAAKKSDHKISLVWKFLPRDMIENGDYFQAELNAAKKAEVVVINAGLGEREEKEGMDRTTISLHPLQRSLIKNVMKVNPNCVVTLQNGGALSLEWIRDHVPAILEIWYPGENGCRVMADMLFGDVNPSGKLPVTFYKSLDDIPEMADAEYEIHKGGYTYMYLKANPAYAFGHGLSYTTFAYSDVSMKKAIGGDQKTINLKVCLENTGAMDGDEVVQVYVRNKESKVYQPVHKLCAFQRVSLKPGESKELSISVDMHQLKWWDESIKGWTLDKGEYEMQVGAASDDIRAFQAFEIQ